MSLSPTGTAGNVQLAWALLAQGKAAEAETVARKASETDARSGEAFAVLGGAIIAADPKKWGDAIAQAQQGAFLNPRNPVVQVEVGRIFDAGGNLDQALASYRKALEADPTYVPALLSQVQAQVRSGKSDEAFASVQNLVRRTPTAPTPSCCYGRMLLRKGDWAGAADRARKGSRGVAAQRRGAGRPRHRLPVHAARPRRRWPRTRRRSSWIPKNLEYRTTYGIMRGINKDYAGGVEELNKVIATPGYKSPDAYLNLGWLYRNMEPRRAEESVTAYQKALELDPTNEQAALGMAWAYSYLKRYDDSIASFNKAVEMAPDLAADAYNGIAWGHFFKKDLPQAEAFLAKARAAGRADARLADNIDRVKKGLEAKAAEPIDEPAPVVRVASDPGTLNQILQNSPSPAVRCKAARDLGKLGAEGVSALIGGLKGDLGAQTCVAQALGSIGAPARAAGPHLLAAAERCLTGKAIPTAEDMKNEAACNVFRNAVRDAMGRIR